MLRRIFCKIRLRNYLPKGIKERTSKCYKQAAGYGGKAVLS